MPLPHTNELPHTDYQVRIPSTIAALVIWVANILLIGGATLISILPTTASSPTLFGGFLIGHVCLGLHSFRLGDRGLLFLNLAMAMLDLYAVGIRL